MRAALMVLTLGVLLALAPGASGSSGTVRTVLTGTCTLKNNNNAIGTTLSSTVTCDATGTCACGGATKLVFHSEAKYPATAPGGREQGSLNVTNADGSLTLSLAGKRQSSAAGTGTWTRGKVTGYAGVTLKKRGTYTVATKTLSQISGTTSSKVRITATLACWSCAG